MILTCPNCGTQYVVKDGAIPPQGRQVRCASCKHSWHEDPEPAGELTLGPEIEASDASDEDESIAEAAVIEPRSGPEAEERAYQEAVLDEAIEEPTPQAEEGHAPVDMHAGLSSDYDAPPGPEVQPDDDFSPFAERDYAEPRRRGAAR
jgi:predicted Zn finger-like uncharacterized protein